MKSIASHLYKQFAVKGSVTVSSSAHIGFGSRIWAASSLVIDSDVYIGKYCTIECNGRIGAGTLIANNVGLVGRSDHDFHQTGRLMRHTDWVGDCERLATEIHIGRDCWIGFGAIILGSVSIGDSVIVGAGSIVTRNLAENTICFGSPAREIRERFSAQEYARHKHLLGDGGEPT